MMLGIIQDVTILEEIEAEVRNQRNNVRTVRPTFRQRLITAAAALVVMIEDVDK